MRILFCWTHLSGYSAACFNELAQRPGVSIRVIHFRSAAAAPFEDASFAGFERVAIEPNGADAATRLRTEVRAFSPDVLVISGWAYAPYRSLAEDRSLRGKVRLVLAADTPARFDLRQRLARLVIRRYLDRFDAIAVPGERGLQVMRYWGVPFERLHVGLYGVAANALASVWERRKAGTWPRRFVFVGRLVAEKGVETLASAYRSYRGAVTDPWPLTFCGTGPLLAALSQVPGVECRGFLQPPQVLEVLQASGVFVLPSWNDPWPLALVEAAAAGLPIACTHACGSAAEIVRTFHNGLLVPPRDDRQLAAALRWFHAHAPELPAMGERSMLLASPYSTARWADRWAAICSGLHQTSEERGTTPLEE